eukprot:Pgem_evm1s2666
MLDIYMINMAQDKANYKRSVKTLKNLGCCDKQIHRFEGINGRKIRREDYQNHLSSTTQMLCTDKIIGVGLSHIFLNKHILSQKLSNDYALIVEDDIKVKEQFNLNSEVKCIIDYYNQNIDAEWDIITLFSQGIKPLDIQERKLQNNNIWSTLTNNLRDKIQFVGSTACYLVSKKGMEKINWALLNDSGNFRTYFHRNLLCTYEQTSQYEFLNAEICEQSIYFWMNQDIGRVPIVGCEVKYKHLFAFQAILVGLLFSENRRLRVHTDKEHDFGQLDIPTSLTLFSYI